MTFISTKIINGKKRQYLEKSIRLPNGNSKKYSIYLKDYKPNIDIKEYEKKLDKDIKKDIIQYSTKFYKKLGIFDEKLIERLEEIKIDYKKITKKLTKKQMEDIIDRFTANFTYESNAIEGNSLTLKDVTMILHEKKISKNNDLREIYETINTREAMELIFKNKLKINEKDIIKLHKIITQNTRISEGYKKIPNFLLGKDLETTPPENVKQEMDKLINWYNENEYIHPLQKASIFHGKFEKIHPFEDGNGRVGRLLINIILINNGYSPLIIRKSQRLAYFSCLEAFDNKYETKLIRFVVEKYKDTYKKFFEIYVKYLN